MPLVRGLAVKPHCLLLINVFTRLANHCRNWDVVGGECLLSLINSVSTIGICVSARSITLSPGNEISSSAPITRQGILRFSNSSSEAIGGIFRYVVKSLKVSPKYCAQSSSQVV